MALENGINNYQNLSINGLPLSYEGKIKVKRGMISRESFPQVNGPSIIISNIETNKSIITIPVRNIKETRDLFDVYRKNGANNVIQLDDENYDRAVLLDFPEAEDQEIVEYVFEANPV